MCLAVVKKTNSNFNYSRLLSAHKANPDGCGFMYVENNEIQIIKGTFSWETFSEIIKAVDKNKNTIVIHFRAASSSKIHYNASHPFMINKNLAFVHNGNFFEFQNYFSKGYPDNMSDTIRFNKFILKKLPKNFLEIPEILSCLESYCKENMSKLVFLEKNGKITIVNEGAGYWENKLWYSNGGIHNYSGYGFSGAYYYNQDDIRHKGGLMTVQMFSEKRRKTWEQCPICLGYFRKSKLISGICKSCCTYRELIDYTD